MTDLQALIQQHADLFQDVFPRARFKQIASLLTALQEIRSPRSRYRIISGDEIQRIEQCCDDLLAASGFATGAHAASGDNDVKALKIGDPVDNKYLIEAIVEPTEHSQVMKAWDEQLQQPVAIKFLLFPPGVDKRQQAASRRQMGREGQILARLRNITHPNIGTVLAYLPEYPAIVKPWLESQEEPLERVVQHRERQLPLKRVVVIGVQLADALELVHAHGIVHRDIKPSNILFNEAGRPVLIDFDIARARDFGTISTESDDGQGYVGSPEYSAPEQFEHPLSVSAPADIFALGAVLYRLLVHAYPYPDGNEPALYRTGLLPQPEQYTIPEPLYTILRAMLQQYPNERPTAGDVRNRLQAYLATLERETHE
jgi:serine/threonine protein kinase